MRLALHKEDFCASVLYETMHIYSNIIIFKDSLHLKDYPFTYFQENSVLYSNFKIQFQVSVPFLVLLQLLDA